MQESTPQPDPSLQEYLVFRGSIYNQQFKLIMSTSFGDDTKPVGNDECYHPKNLVSLCLPPMRLVYRSPVLFE